MGPAGSGRRSATRDVLRLPEFRALAAAGLLSTAGDQLARVALSVLVYDRTSSPLLTALTYALTFLPAVVGGPLLSGLADRRPRRQLMVAANGIQAAAVAVMALPGLPLAVLLILLVGVNLLAAPYGAARAALLPDLTGGRYVAALVVDRTLQQTAQVIGFAGSGLLFLVFDPNAALLGDAVSFAASALLLRRWIADRPAVAATTAAPGASTTAAPGAFTTAAPAAPNRAARARQDAALGMRTIWCDPTVRRAVLLTWLAAGFAVVPEGLAAPYARQLAGGPVLVALLLAANPVGNVVSGLWAARWSGDRPERALAPLGQLVVLPLAVCVLDPPAVVVLGLVVLSGIGMTVSLVARTVFVARVPDRVRGRAFGVAAAGIIVSQAVTVALAGVAALLFAPSTVVGGAGLLGSLATLLLLGALRQRRPPHRPAVETNPLETGPVETSAVETGAVEPSPVETTPLKQALPGSAATTAPVIRTPFAPRRSLRTGRPAAAAGSGIRAGRSGRESARCVVDQLRSGRGDLAPDCW